MSSTPSSATRLLVTLAFGLIAVLGALGCWKSLEILREPGGDARAVIGLVLGAVLLAVGLGGGVLVRRSFVALGERARMEQQRPGQPWAWRKDWAAGRVPGQGRTAAFGLLVFGLIWSAITGPVAWLFISRTDDPNVYAVLFFPGVGLLLLFAAVRGMLQARRFGRPHLVLQTNPGVVGRAFEGYVETPLQDAPPGGVDVALRCDRERVTGTRKHRSRQTTTLWRDDVTLEPLELARGAKGLRIPVSFPIPADARPSDDGDPEDSIRWYVAVAAKLPGVDFEDSFEVPVFATGAPPLSDAERAALRARRRARAQARVPARPLFRSGQTSRGGRVFDFVRHVKPSTAIGTVAMTLASWAAVWWLHSRGIVIGAYVVAFFGLLFGVGTVVALFHCSSVTIEAGQVTLRHRVLGIGPTRRIAAAQVTDVRAKAIGEGDARSWEVEVIVDGGTAYSAAALFETQRDAEWVAEQLRATLGPPA